MGLPSVKHDKFCWVIRVFVLLKRATSLVIMSMSPLGKPMVDAIWRYFLYTNPQRQRLSSLARVI